MCQMKQSVFACSHFSPTRLSECQQLIIRRTHPEMNALTKRMWAEPHSYEQVYDYLDNRICDACILQNSEARVSTAPQSMMWRKQGWGAGEEARALEAFLQEEENRREREERLERRIMRRMDMMGLVEKERGKRKCPDFADILILEEMKGIFEDIDWDIEPGPKEARMDTPLAVLLDGEWMDVKESRARVTQQAFAEKGRRLHQRFKRLVSLWSQTKGGRILMNCRWDGHHDFRNH